MLGAINIMKTLLSDDKNEWINLFLPSKQTVYQCV